MDALKGELQDVLASIRSQHDFVPFLGKMIATGSARLEQPPKSMLALLRGSADFMPPVIGAVTWFQVEAPQGQAELVVYRALADGEIYIFAPETTTTP